MSQIGVFEAKTKFSELCEHVAARREVVVVTRRGKPLVKISPIADVRGKRDSVWDRRAAYERHNGRLKEDFSLPRRGKQTWRNPLDK